MSTFCALFCAIVREDAKMRTGMRICAADFSARIVRVEWI
jgi:hypothetical protein